jgi:hypothetical protein
MRQCAVCLTETEDHITLCPNCGADLAVDSVRARALEQIRHSPRASMVHVMVGDDCCPACRQVEGTYDKDNVPELPVPGCSGEHGCRCQYEPFVIEVGP